MKWEFPEWFASLSRREREVFLRYARGETAQAIARDTALAVSTVQTYRWRIGKKLKCNTDSQLTLLAVRGGLVS